MQSNFKYRLIALTLTIIFAVFNIGLPVVVASCPMMQTMDASACCATNDDATPGVLKFTNTVDKSCCATKFAADRNKTEFLQSNQTVEHAKQSFDFQLVALSFTPGLQSPVSRLRFVDSSPPQTRDIPIFISSLLI